MNLEIGVEAIRYLGGRERWSLLLWLGHGSSYLGSHTPLIYLGAGAVNDRNFWIKATIRRSPS
jgi:hypothetical protein